MTEDLENPNARAASAEASVQSTLARFMDFAADGKVFSLGWRQSLLYVVNPSSPTALSPEELRQAIRENGLAGAKAKLLSLMLVGTPSFSRSVTEEDLHAFIAYDPSNPIEPSAVDRLEAEHSLPEDRSHSDPQTLMPLPKEGSQEWFALEERAHRRIMDTVSNVAVRRRLPQRVHAIIHDEITGERFGAFVGVEYIGDSGAARITRTTIGIVRPGVQLTNIADLLLEHDPGIPIVCDKRVAEELSEESIPWVEEGHYRLEGRPRGVMEVYVHYDANHLPGDMLSPGTASAQFYTE